MIVRRLVILTVGRRTLSSVVGGKNGRVDSPKIMYPPSAYEKPQNSNNNNGKPVSSSSTSSTTSRGSPFGNSAENILVRAAAAAAAAGGEEGKQHQQQQRRRKNSTPTPTSTTTTTSSSKEVNHNGNNAAQFRPGREMLPEMFSKQHETWPLWNPPPLTALASSKEDLLLLASVERARQLLEEGRMISEDEDWEMLEPGKKSTTTKTLKKSSSKSKSEVAPAPVSSTSSSPPLAQYAPNAAIRLIQPRMKGANELHRVIGYYSLARAYTYAGEHLEAHTSYLHAIRILEQNGSHGYGMASCLAGLASCVRYVGEIEELHSVVIQLLQEVNVAQNHRPTVDVALVLIDLGMINVAMRRYEQAIAEGEKALAVLEMCRSSRSEEESVISRHETDALTVVGHASCLTGRVYRAEECFLKALDNLSDPAVFDTKAASNDANLANVLHLLGRLYWQMGRRKLAWVRFREAVEVAMRAVGDEEENGNNENNSNNNGNNNRYVNKVHLAMLRECEVSSRPWNIEPM